MNIRTALFVTTSLLGAMALAACDGGTGGEGGSAGAGGSGGGTTTTSMTTTSSAMGGWIRLGHFSPDSMGVDFCATGSDMMARGPLAGTAAGATYPGVTPYVELPADTYTINVIGAGQTCADTPIGTVPDYQITAGTYHTTIVDGLQADMSLAVGMYVDENMPAAANVYLNVCHENPGAPPVQVGTVDAMGAFTSIFNEAAGTPVTLNYQDCVAAEVPGPIAQGTVIGVSQDGTTVDGRWTVPVELTAGGAATMFAYGADAATLGLYACDNIANVCTVLPAAN